MKKEEKATAVAELTEKFGRARLAIVTECVGLPVNHVTELRKQLRGAKAEYGSSRIRSAMRAAEGTIVAGLKAYLKGPTGVIIGYDDPVLPTKVLKDFIGAEKREEKIRMTARRAGGQDPSAGGTGGRREAAEEGSARSAMLLSAMQGPIRGVVYTLNAVLSSLYESLQPFKINGKEKGTCQLRKENCRKRN